MSMSEARVNVAVDRDWCLRSLMGQADGRQIDTLTDGYLIEQLNASHVDDVEDGYVTECQVGGCALACFSTNEQGILRVQVQSGEAACDLPE